MSYKVFSLSKPGIKYARQGFSCQDSSGYCMKNGIQIVAVADGHGVGDCFRSEIGASIAVDTVFARYSPSFMMTGILLANKALRISNIHFGKTGEKR